MACLHSNLAARRCNSAAKEATKMLRKRWEQRWRHALSTRKDMFSAHSSNLQCRSADHECAFLGLWESNLTPQVCASSRQILSSHEMQ